MYYVYVHRRPTDNSIFYIGKGKRSRVSSSNSRSRYWRNIVSKNGGFNYEIVRSFEDEMCALSYEKCLIHLLRNERLCNMTAGGEGFSGGSHSEETRKRIANTLRRVRSCVPKEILDKIVRTKRASGVYERHSKAMKDKYKKHSERVKTAVATGSRQVTLTHKVHGTETMYPFEWKDKYGLHSWGIKSVADGSYSQHKGWRTN